MRTNLKIYRIKKHMTQSEIAERIPCSRATYQAIESGVRDGRKSFWDDFQRSFCIPSAEMFELMKNE